MTVLEICQWIQDTSVAIAINESVWLFPLILSVHALGTTLSVGTLVWFDLRLLGVKMRQQAVSEVYRQLGPWMICGFALMALSGSLLFWASAARLYMDVFFRVKCLALVCAGGNAAIYHLVVRRNINLWDKAQVPPLTARISGLVSLIAWTVTIVSGRLIFS